MARTFNCPSCGAPLEPDGEKTTIICKYCGESVIVPADLRAHSHPRAKVQRVDSPLSMVDLDADAQNRYRAERERIDAQQIEWARTVRHKKSRSGGWVFILILALGMMILVMAAGGMPVFEGLMGAFNAATGAKVDLSAVTQKLDTIVKPDVRVMLPLHFPSNVDSLSPDFLAPINDGGTGDYQYAWVDGVKKTILWRSDPLSKDWTQARAFVLDQQVIIIDQTDMSALNRQTGKPLWKLALDNGLGYCKTCLVQSGSILLVILKDGTLQAVDGTSGKLTWHKTITSTNSDLFLAGGLPAVEDREDNKNVVYIFDPLTGKIARRIQPDCSSAGMLGGAFSEFELSADGKSLLVLYDGCIQTVSLPEGKVLTQVVDPQAASHFEGPWPMAWFATKRMVTRDAIFYTDNGSNQPLNMVDITKGNARQLIVDNKYSLLPKMLAGSVLIAEATPGFDSNQHEYWGIDTASGKRLWQYALKGQGELEYYDVHALSTGAIFVVQCRRDPNSCAWANLDPKTGVGTHQGSGPGGTFFDPAWYKDTFYLANDGMLMVIDANSGKLQYQWP